MIQFTKEINDLTYKIIGACMKVHNGIGPGFPEEYYQNALVYEFTKQDIPFEAQKPLIVYYEDVQVGISFLDFLIDDIVILEIKSLAALNNVHKYQVMKYFASSEYSVGLLVNFGAERLQYERLVPPEKIQKWKQAQNEKK